jgi:hypothetical protein
MKGRELLSYQDASVQCELDCFYNPKERKYLVVLEDKGRSISGETIQLTSAQLEKIENRIRAHLGSVRFFGIPIGQRLVAITRKQNAI